MTAKKVVVLLLTASVILVLFLTRTVKSEAEPEIETSWQQVERNHTYISPYDSLFRQYADKHDNWIPKSWNVIFDGTFPSNQNQTFYPLEYGLCHDVKLLLICALPPHYYVVRPYQ